MNANPVIAQISDPIFNPASFSSGGAGSTPLSYGSTPSGGGAGSLSLSIPGLGGAGGLGLNFDFGGNPTAAAATSYQFLQTVNGQDQQFLANAISGTQGFLGNMVSPIVNAASAQINANTTALPTLYNNLFSLGQQGIASANTTAQNAIVAQQATANASIASSNASANSGGCFITAAACEAVGLNDDCDMLTTFRAFRDQYVRKEKPEWVCEYYKIAPKIVEDIRKRSDGMRRLRRIHFMFLIPAYLAIKKKEFKKAMLIYASGVRYAQELTQ